MLYSLTFTEFFVILQRSVSLMVQNFSCPVPTKWTYGYVATIIRTKGSHGSLSFNILIYHDVLTLQAIRLQLPGNGGTYGPVWRRVFLPWKTQRFLLRSHSADGKWGQNGRSLEPQIGIECHLQTNGNEF